MIECRKLYKNNKLKRFQNYLINDDERESCMLNKQKEKRKTTMNRKIELFK